MMGAVLSVKRRALVGIGRAERTFLNGVSSKSTSVRDLEGIACGLFLVSFSTYEICVSELFYLYAQGFSGLSGQAPLRYVTPRDRQHALSLSKSGKSILGWAEAERVIERCDDWFEDGSLLGDAIKNQKSTIDKARKCRNYIAHQSDEAWRKFAEVWASDIGPVPLVRPRVGEFLLMRRGRPRISMFERYVGELKRTIIAACG